MNNTIYYERRGTMIYIEENTSPNKQAQYVAECNTVDEAQSIVQRLNELTDEVARVSEILAKF